MELILDIDEEEYALLKRAYMALQHPCVLEYVVQYVDRRGDNDGSWIDYWFKLVHYLHIIDQHIDLERIVSFIHFEYPNWIKDTKNGNRDVRYNVIKTMVENIYQKIGY